MHPRLTMFSVLGVLTDLLCMLAFWAVFLSNSAWMANIGQAQFWLVVFMLSLVAVPMLYRREKLWLVKQYTCWPTEFPSLLSAAKDPAPAIRGPAVAA